MRYVICMFAIGSCGRVCPVLVEAVQSLRMGNEMQCNGEESGESWVIMWDFPVLRSRAELDYDRG